MGRGVVWNSCPGSNRTGGAAPKERAEEGVGGSTGQLNIPKIQEPTGLSYRHAQKLSGAAQGTRPHRCSPGKGQNSGHICCGFLQNPFGDAARFPTVQRGKS